MESCSITDLSQEDCHKTSYTTEVELIPGKTLSFQEQELVLLRSSLKEKSDQVSNLCMHQKEIFWGPNEYRFKSCSIIYKSHKKKAKRYHFNHS